MKEKDAQKLKSGQRVMHNRYGACEVKEVIADFGLLFGVVITPATESGLRLLWEDSKTNITDFLEDEARRISIIENVKAVKAGDKPIDLETAWGESEKDLPEQEPKNHFAPKDKEVSS